MPEVTVAGIRLSYEERGDGAPILGIHGTGSSYVVWGDAVEALAGLGRVVVYDRRGHGQSERPEPYDRTSVAEHADDAAALLQTVDAVPAVVIGRSYGAAVALDLALRHRDLVRAVVLLEPVELEIVPTAAEWARALGDRLGAVAAESGVDAVAEAMISDALGEETWASLPEELRQLFTHNGAAILAEQQGEYLDADEAAFATVDQPVLLVTAADSLPVLHEVAGALAGVLPNARSTMVAGGHLIDPAHPEILDFISQVVSRSPPRRS